MSQVGSAHGLWIGSPRPARERLSTAVAALIRARRMQVLVNHGFGGLLAGLSVATFLVLVARLAPIPHSPWYLAGAVVIVAVALALLVGWRRRPDALDVTIRADLALSLKQRLSTAWEFTTAHGDAELAERLAAQAVKAGLPTDPRRLFPLRVNRWGRLAPLAAIALLLASTIDLNWMQASAPVDVDEQVVREGQRLGAFGHAMQERARRDQLPRSDRQAAQLERLGARMESGALNRGEALGQLRGMSESLDQERTQLLAEASATDIGPLHADSAQTPPRAPDSDPRAMLQPMERDARGSTGTRALAELEHSSIPRGEMEDSLTRQLPGDNEELRQKLERLAQIDRARKEDRELRSAREQVRLARENLGESLGGSDAERDLALNLDWGEDEGRGNRGTDSAETDVRQPGKSARGAAGASSQGDPGVAFDRRRESARPDAGQSGPVLKPESRASKGEVFVTEARILPKPGRPSVENVAMSSDFAPQVEAVLSRDEYPAHYKEFVRRYFLKLSEGRAPQQRPASDRGAK